LELKTLNLKAAMHTVTGQW